MENLYQDDVWKVFLLQLHSKRLLKLSTNKIANCELIILIVDAYSRQIIWIEYTARILNEKDTYIFSIFKIHFKIRSPLTGQNSEKNYFVSCFIVMSMKLL